MAYLIDLRPGEEPMLVECADGGLSREQVRELAGGDYVVVPTYITDLVLLLCGEGSEDENEIATDMLSATDTSVVRGRAFLARAVKNRVTGLTRERAEYGVRNLKE